MISWYKQWGCRAACSPMPRAARQFIEWAASSGDVVSRCDPLGVICLRRNVRSEGRAARGRPSPNQVLTRGCKAAKFSATSGGRARRARRALVRATAGQATPGKPNGLN